jgi:beta-galactosidase
VLEVEKMRSELEPILTSTSPLQAEAAITYSDRAKMFMKTEPHKGLQYKELIIDFYEQILNTGIHRDLLTESEDLSGYKLLFTPFVHYLSPDYIRRAVRFVEAGGIWVAGPMTGGRTEHHTIHTDAALGELEELAGVEALYTFPMEETGAVGEAFGTAAPLGLWSSVFEAKGAEEVGRIEGGLTPGKLFLTEHQRGKGKIVMLGSLPMGEDGRKMMQEMISKYAADAGVEVKADVTEGTIIAPREKDGRQVWVIINMDGQGGRTSLPAAGMDVLSGKSVPEGELNLGRYEYRVIQF